MFRSERALRIICFESVFLAFYPGGCLQSHTGQGFSSCVFSCQRAKKSIVLGHFSFQFELWLFLIWSWSIPVGASEIRCSTRIFAVSKTAATDHSRHESAKCEQDSKSGSRASGSWVRIPPYPPKKASAQADAFLTKQIPAGSVKCTLCVKFALRRVNCLWAWADLLCFTWRKAPNFTLHRERQRTTSLPALDCAGATALPCYTNSPFLCAVV